ncbi:hypothetical protein V6N13_139506 [Hibiscus sabdariffa]|uniref:B3 domain-containing protein n=1 Tax=Hibiscus sabdariffa TaxID=183260 RepID=A0ABR2C7W9_9ROSI
MQDRKLIAFDFMDEGGNIRPKQGNPDSHVSLDLSLSLGSTPSSAASKVKHEIDYKELQCKEKNSSGAFPLGSGTDVGISLELSLSCGNTSTEAIQYQCTRGLAVADMMCMEKSDISLDLCLGMNKRPRIDVGDHRNRNDNCGLGLTLALKRRKLSSDTNKTRKLVEAGSHDPWCIKKKIVTSDLSDMSRLLLAKKLVESHILPHWDADRRAQIHTGVQVSVYDCDTNDEYAMDFKRWRNGAYVFIKKWIPNFVNRRALKLDDEIGIYWDIHNSRFNFSVLNRAPME